MSNWTHVAGIIRIDSIRIFENNIDFDKLIGKEIEYDSSLTEWDTAYEHPEEYMPFGSEGSLQKSIWVNPDKDCLSAYTVSVFGDLRDYDDLQEVVKWFKITCSKFDDAIRNAVIVVHSDMNNQIVWAYPGGNLDE